MKNKKTATIAVIGVPGLIGLGLKSLLESNFVVEVVLFADSRELMSRQEQFDVYIPEIEAFASHLHFYLPRKSNTVLFFSYPQHESAPALPMSCIHLCDTEAQVTGCIQAMLQNTPDVETTAECLSDREKEVLRQIAAGKSNKEVAEALGISVNTAITHRKNISAKLGIRSVSGLSIYAMKNGLI